MCVYWIAFSIEQSLIIIPNACHSFIRLIRSTEFDITHALFRAHQLHAVQFFCIFPLWQFVFGFVFLCPHAFLKWGVLFPPFNFYATSKTAYQYVTIPSEREREWVQASPYLPIQNAFGFNRMRDTKKSELKTYTRTKIWSKNWRAHVRIICCWYRRIVIRNCGNGF